MPSAALITLAALILLARPLTVLACLLPDRRGRWQRPELVFLSWTRETGVVPAALVGVLVAEGVPYETEIVTTVASPSSSRSSSSRRRRRGSPGGWRLLDYDQG